jgi:phosphoglycolate phosphatase
LVFDLDGTLWDTGESCARGWNNVLARHALPFRVIVGDDVRRVAGKPHDQCIRETFHGFSEEQLRMLAEETALEDNRMIEQHGGVLYPGVAEGLVQLARKYPLFIVSNCQRGYIELFLRTRVLETPLEALFVDWECWGDSGLSKPENLRDLIARNGLKQPWFIGDAAGDQQAARACNVPFVHAAYGFGACDGADLVLHDFGALLRAL